ncbi:MAG: hypothetical protein LBO72_08090 [Helicobacteraceae bacterium]|jgi:hypothetical protein|nr:hypothetical protein [Helicobacteraceae bacterium]
MIYVANGGANRAQTARLDTEQAMIYELFHLSAKGDGFGGFSADYALARDYCDRYGLDRIEVWRTLKSMSGAYQASAQKRKGK